MTTKVVTHCGRCHKCGTKLLSVLDGEEWCPKCNTYRRYKTHGWTTYATDTSPCPQYTDTWTTDSAVEFHVITDED